jgi:hypothetical protein
MKEIAGWDKIKLKAVQIYAARWLRGLHVSESTVSISLRESSGELATWGNGWY